MAENIQTKILHKWIGYVYMKVLAESSCMKALPFRALIEKRSGRYASKSSDASMSTKASSKVRLTILRCARSSERLSSTV